MPQALSRNHPTKTLRRNARGKVLILWRHGLITKRERSRLLGEISKRYQD
jgi:hypothetical protein